MREFGQVNTEVGSKNWMVNQIFTYEEPAADTKGPTNGSFKIAYVDFQTWQRGRLKLMSVL